MNSVASFREFLIPFRKTKSLKGSNYVQERYLAAIFRPKTFSARLPWKICKYLIEFIVSRTFWRHFRPSWAIKPQSINFFLPNFWVFDKFFFSNPVLGKRRLNNRLLRYSFRVVSSENSTFCQKFLGSKACSFAQTFLASRFLAVR